VHRSARQLGRYGYAIRHMRTRQLLGRSRRLIPPTLLGVGRTASAARWAPLAQGLGVDPAPQSGPQPAPHLDGTFRAVGESRAFPSSGFWLTRENSLLFHFHLHGFSELARYAAGSRTAAGDGFWSSVLASWLEECAAPRRPAWHPFPTSGRVIAWCSALSAGGWEAELERRTQASLQRQVRLLRRSIEHDIGGNHVLRNAVALVVGGACLRDERTERLGLRLLRNELARQILDDGGHEERSTAYQRAIVADLHDVLLLLERSGRKAPAWLAASVERMQGWLDAVRGPDGRLPLLNDAWDGPSLQRPPADSVTDLADSGYLVIRDGLDQAIFDVGPLAPPHLPPHAHADALSFVLWADGQLLVADPGSFTYSGPDRDRFRGTSAHNTVELDGEDQCDFWGPFRAAHMPRVRRLQLEDRGNVTVLVAEHDGYRRLKDPAVHRRTFCWVPGAGLVVVDRLIAGRQHTAVSRLHLAPGQRTDGSSIGPLVLVGLGVGGGVEVEPSLHAPYLAQTIAAATVVRRWSGTGGALTGWSLLREGTTARLGERTLRIARRGDTILELDVG
jgi:uncharacterized heparinase superfamily protein